MTAPKAPGAGGPAEVAGGADPAGPADLSNAGGLAAPAGPTSTAGTAYAVDPNELAGRLRTVVLRMSHQLRGPVDKHGLTPTRLAVLAALKEANAPVRPGDLAARLAISPPGMSRLVEILEHAGWVRRQPDPGDQRACLLSLTSDGHATMAGLARQSAGRLASDVAALGPAEQARLAAALEVLEHLAEQGVCRHPEGAGCDRGPAAAKPGGTPTSAPPSQRIRPEEKLAGGDTAGSTAGHA